MAGGTVTALFSLGIDDFLAIYLILSRFLAKVAIAVAVWVCAIWVVAGFWDGYLTGLARLEIAVQGAMVGGFQANGMAQPLGSLWLKTLASIWIITSSLYLTLT